MIANTVAHRRDDDAISWHPTEHLGKSVFRQLADIRRDVCAESDEERLLLNPEVIASNH